MSQRRLYSNDPVPAVRTSPYSPAQAQLPSMLGVVALLERAKAKGVPVGDLVNDLLKRDIVRRKYRKIRSLPSTLTEPSASTATVVKNTCDRLLRRSEFRVWLSVLFTASPGILRRPPLTAESTA